MFSLSLACRRVARSPSALWQVGRGYAAKPETKPSPPPQEMDEGERKIMSKLSSEFTPSHLAVQDISGGCGSFYAISITSDKFRGLSTVKQHRLVNAVLKDEIDVIHGLQVLRLEAHVAT
ncbi:hypothetical protein NLI96_g5651 [Meripilus lineatus]|uniref:Bola-like protein n=1 Tax=Meripilus lineatus TaxID=2056292 RepID=A0AAD5YDP7_9APHY|nr:hypothetical protein NLI96_g5651 [Physisporinus lineatus]